MYFGKAYLFNQIDVLVHDGSSWQYWFTGNQSYKGVWALSCVYAVSLICWFSIGSLERRLRGIWDINGKFIKISCRAIPHIWNQERDPNRAWAAFGSITGIAELAKFAVILLKIVVNQAGCECVFSDMKIKQTQCHNHLCLEKLEKMKKVS